MGATAVVPMTSDDAGIVMDSLPVSMVDCRGRPILVRLASMRLVGPHGVWIGARRGLGGCFGHFLFFLLGGGQGGV